jgi:hypothetical protein
VKGKAERGTGRNNSRREDRILTVGLGRVRDGVVVGEEDALLREGLEDGCRGGCLALCVNTPPRQRTTTHAPQNQYSPTTPV